MRLLTVLLARAHLRLSIWHGARGEALLDRYQAGQYLDPWPVLAGIAVVLVAWLIL